MKRKLIIAAMDSEIACIKRKMVIEREYHRKNLSFYWGQYLNRSILLVKTGVGKKNTIKALNEIIINEVDTIINIGLAGALKAYLKIGDLVIARAIRSIQVPDIYYQADQRLLEKNIRIQEGRIYEVEMMTTNKICVQKDKKMIFDKYPSIDAIEMESFYISRYCFENKIPFISIRAISDTVDYKFPSFILIKEKLYLKEYFKAIRVILLHPGELLAAVRLRRNCRKAIKMNIKYLEDYLKII